MRPTGWGYLLCVPTLTPVVPQGFARLTPEVDALLKSFCSGHHVVDLGAGKGALSARMVEMGAVAVTAIEKEDMPSVAGVVHERRYFSQMDIERLPRRALLSWPTSSIGATDIAAVGAYLARAEQILYIGLNDRFTICGWLELWDELTGREVLSVVQVGHHNVAVRYGARLPLRRTMDLLLQEECAALAISQKQFARFGR